MKDKPANIVRYLPNKPGVYQFLNAANEVIYVGKAKDLKKRVSSYFNKSKYESAKLRVLVSKVVDIKHIIVDTESDALLLENNLIKKIKPKYNVLLKDDKTYPWICIKNEPFPRVYSTRRIVHDGSMYFGPYTSGVLLKTILDLIKSLYPLRTCNLVLNEHNIKSGKFKPCLEYQIGNCLAPCVGNQSAESYNEGITLIVDILNGNIQAVKRVLKVQMLLFAKNYQFEHAQQYKEKIAALERFQAKSTIVNPKLTDIDVFSIIEDVKFSCVNFIKVVQGSVIQSHNIELKKSLNESVSDLLALAITELRQRVNSKAKEILVPFIPEFTHDDLKYTVPTRGDKLKLLQLSQRNAKAYVNERNIKFEKMDGDKRKLRIIKVLHDDFKTKTLPYHIECFDNSNLQGTNPVSACVVFKDAKPSKRDYRLFNIKSVDGPDDFASMAEVITRRYSRLLSTGQSLPQLVVIDGGKGQLSAAYGALKQLDLHNKISIIGIAKRLEEIYFPGDPIPLYLDKNSESLKVIQNARNEAHRFSIKHHRNRRSNTANVSQLSGIKGVGQKSVEQLFKKYKSIHRIAVASVGELSSLIGEQRARLVYNHFNSLTSNQNDVKS
ncbi:MAG: excinuclease ABC subunit UvrC [Tenuifilaceae bacterium]|nr:excinuclease ABC subunit UvrC [Tenuifilaceae bacterium]